MKEALFRELGRVIGTAEDYGMFARHFRCTVEEAQQAVRALISEGRVTRRAGLLYRSF